MSAQRADRPVGSTQAFVAEHTPNKPTMLPCPHCLRYVGNLTDHLRDDGGVGTRCAELSKQARIGRPIDLTTMEEL